MPALEVGLPMPEGGDDVAHLRRGGRTISKLTGSNSVVVVVMAMIGFRSEVG